MKASKKDSNKKNLIVLDIGSQFAKALLLEIGDENKGIIHHWAKESICNQKEDTRIINLERFFLPCQKAIKKIEEKIGIRPKQLFLGLGDEIIRGASTNFCYKRENSEQGIDISELRYVVQKTQRIAFEKIRKNFVSDTPFSEIDLQLINAYIVDIKIDNKTIPNPLGFRGRVICLTIFNTYTIKEKLDVLIQLSIKLEQELISIVPRSYALFNSLDSELLEKDAMIIDVGGKNTEIVFIKNKGEIIETNSFHLGGEVFTKKLAGFLEIDFDDAETIKLQYSRGGVGYSAKRKIENLFEPDIHSWLGGVRVISNDFLKKHESFPKRVFICGGGSELPGIKKALEKEEKFEVMKIPFREIINIENKTRLQNIPSLALSRLALESAKDTFFSSTLKRIIRLTQE